MTGMTFLCLLWFATLGSTTSQNEFPTVRWGQSSKKLTLIISIPSVEGEKVEFTESYVNTFNEDLHNIPPKEPCWKRLTKNKTVNFLVKDKRLSDPTDCEEAKEVWLGEYM
ncbi:hypothetical protein PCYB_147540 [Plasmodium cynomolgi strain B]|uniref:CYIR protein n=1 Tax=Plasmodium cynomolgi (strain B) TaxID=1120755 RepID=K6UF18_PLACD|nr:hypothetical protein PCYB_147540 [Plasmodium cynomolgi strain B]GAB69326.1 hypothetical protein PCYB_147540 [Plasmodium cynomolgi strain B]